MPSRDIFSLGRMLWQWLTKVDTVEPSMLEPVAELIEAMVCDDAERRPDAGGVAKQLLRLEIETLGRHIGPPSRRAA